MRGCRFVAAQRAAAARYFRLGPRPNEFKPPGRANHCRDWDDGAAIQAAGMTLTAHG